MYFLLRLVLASLLVTTPVLAEAATWQIDPDHAFVEFKVKHLMVSSVKGVFTKLSGTVEADDADLDRVLSGENRLDETLFSEGRDDHAIAFAELHWRRRRASRTSALRRERRRGLLFLRRTRPQPVA